MKNKKVVHLVRPRKPTGNAVREIRQLLNQIDSGEVVGISLAVVKRDGSVYTYTDNDDYLKALGASSLLHDHIVQRHFTKD